MTSEQFEAFLAQAGVDAGAVGAAERLLLPEPQVDEARTARIGTASVPPALLHVRSDALSAAGIEAGFDEDARTLVLSARQDLAFGLAESGAPCTSGEAGGTRFHVATDRPSAFGLWSVAGPLAIGSIDARAIELRVVHAWPAPLDSGSERLRSRTLERLRSRFHSGVVRQRSRWDETLAAGRIARAMEPGASQAATIAARRWTRGAHRRPADADRALRDRPGARHRRAPRSPADALRPRRRVARPRLAGAVLGSRRRRGHPRAAARGRRGAGAERRPCAPSTRPGAPSVSAGRPTSTCTTSACSASRKRIRARGGGARAGRWCGCDTAAVRAHVARRGRATRDPPPWRSGRGAGRCTPPERPRCRSASRRP